MRILPFSWVSTIHTHPPKNTTRQGRSFVGMVCGSLSPIHSGRKKRGLYKKGFLQNPVSRRRKQKLPKVIGPSSSSTFGTQSATAERERERERERDVHSCKKTFKKPFLLGSRFILWVRKKNVKCLPNFLQDSSPKPQKVHRQASIGVQGEVLGRFLEVTLGRALRRGSLKGFLHLFQAFHIG